MLKTLLKYEWKDTWGLCTACNGIALILSVIGALMISLWHYSDDKTFTDTQTTMLGVAFSFYIIIYIVSVFAIVLVILIVVLLIILLLVVRIYLRIRAI